MRLIAPRPGPDPDSELTAVNHGPATRHSPKDHRCPRVGSGPWPRSSADKDHDKADDVVVEINFGGDMATEVVKQAAERVH